MGNDLPKESRENREIEEPKDPKEPKEPKENKEIKRNDVEVEREVEQPRKRCKHDFMDSNLGTNKTIHINGAKYDRLFKYFLHNNHNVSEKL